MVAISVTVYEGTGGRRIRPRTRVGHGPSKRTFIVEIYRRPGGSSKSGDLTIFIFARRHLPSLHAHTHTRMHTRVYYIYIYIGVRVTRILHGSADGGLGWRWR